MEHMMTPHHPRWDEFVELLDGPAGCNFRLRPDGMATWDCAGGYNKDLSMKILQEHFPEIDLDASLNYFTENGGHCDCEIIFNIALANVI